MRRRGQPAAASVRWREARSLAGRGGAVPMGECGCAPVLLSESSCLETSNLRLFGPDEEALCQLLRAALGLHTVSFVRQLVDTVVARCSNEAQRWMRLGHNWAAEEWEGSPEAAPGPAASQRGSPAPSPAPSSSPDRSEAEELPSTSSAALHGGPSSTRSVPVPTHGDPEEPRADPEEAGPTASTPIQGSQCSPGSAQRAPKRRAGSPEATSPPNKRPPHRRQ